MACWRPNGWRILGAGRGVARRPVHRSRRASASWRPHVEKYGLLALPFLGPYAASKFALEAVSDSWRVELKPWGIAVALVEPGAVATPVWGKGALRARHAFEAMPPGAHELYGPVFGMLAGIQRHGLPLDEAARRVEHALLAPRPKARYPVGRNARLFGLLRRLPVRLRDWFLVRRLPTYP
jgi:NAD(P)-dependent dehydrogenase (short-subunit alcohol dehydrogenase family)